MSIKIMSLVFERFEGGGNLMLLALALADHANDAGESIHPSVARLAQKTRQSERSVQRMLRQLESMGWLEVLEQGSGRTHTTQYRINPAWIKGDNLAPFKRKKGDRLSPISAVKGDNGDAERVTPEVVKGDRAVSPESSGTVNKNSEHPLTPSARGNGALARHRRARPIRTESARAWIAVLETARRGGSTAGDPLIDQAVRLMGGYNRIGQAHTSKTPDNRRAFREHFEHLLERQLSATPEAAQP